MIADMTLASFNMSYLTFVLSFCLVVGAAALTILLFIGDKRKLGFWSGFGLSVAACGVAIAAQNYTGLVDWIILGATGVSLSAGLFLVGMIAMISVMLWNFVSTGKQLVR